MTDYELGREGRRNGMAYHAAPYWSWFRRYSWQRGWHDEDEALRTVHGRNSAQSTLHHPAMQPSSTL